MNRNGKVSIITAANQPEYIRREVTPLNPANRMPYPSRAKTRAQQPIQPPDNLHDEIYEGDVAQIEPGQYVLSVGGEEVIRTFDKDQVSAVITELVVDRDVPVEEIYLVKRESISFQIVLE